MKRPRSHLRILFADGIPWQEKDVSLTFLAARLGTLGSGLCTSPECDGTFSFHASFTTGRVRKCSTRDTGATLPHLRELHHFTGQIGTDRGLTWCNLRGDVTLVLGVLNLRTRPLSANRRFTPPAQFVRKRCSRVRCQCCTYERANWARTVVWRNRALIGSRRGKAFFFFFRRKNRSRTDAVGRLVFRRFLGCGHSCSDGRI